MIEPQYASQEVRPNSLDREIIAQLRFDGRCSVAKLAEIVGVARATVQMRLDRLLDTGTIQGFTVRVRDDASDHAVRAVMLIELVGLSTDRVIRKLRGIPEIQVLHTTNGNWDLVAEIQAAGLGDFDRVLGDVRAIEGVLNSDTSLLLSSI